jgi:putative ABC transport system substrate-binding protein
MRPWPRPRLTIEVSCCSGTKVVRTGMTDEAAGVDWGARRGGGVAARGARAPPNRIRLLGVLIGVAESDPVGQALFAAFRAALATLGWTEDGNLRIELRWGGSNADRIRILAKELVDLQPDAIFDHSTPVARALARETRTIPIVFVNVSDPIGDGIVASLAHPGGNMTGFMNLDPAMSGKWVELLKEIAPRTVRAAVLFNPATAPRFQFTMLSIQAAASSLGVEVSATPVQAKNEIEGVISAQARNPGGGLIMAPDVFIATNRDLIIALAARYGAPAIYFLPFFAKAGGLITYGDDPFEQWRLAAGYIDRILKGAKPADLAVQAPTKFQLVINLKTANALGLTVPPTLLARADEVIE